MRLLINCPSGESRLLQVDQEASVLELKQLLQEAEGIPVKQQVSYSRTAYSGLASCFTTSAYSCRSSSMPGTISKIISLLQVRT
jgi:hypothetical protein